MAVEDEIDFLGGRFDAADAAKPRRARTNPERAVQIAILKFCKLCVRGGFAFHVANETDGSRNTRAHLHARAASGVVAGVPDLFVCWPGGGSCWLEVKAPGAKATDQQLHIHSVLRANDQCVAVVHSVEEAEAALRSFGAPVTGRA